jgi:hypothetical protein
MGNRLYQDLPNADDRPHQVRPDVCKPSLIKTHRNQLHELEMRVEITRSASQEKTLARIDAIRTEIMRQGPLASNRPNAAALAWGASP